MKTIGIIGGMGPLATADLFKCIVQMTNAKSDNDHIPILIDNNTRISDRTAAIINDGKDPRPELIKSAGRLVQMGADFLIMPCNTAHYFYDDIIREVNIPFINMIDETVSVAKHKGFKTVGLLSTAGTSQCGIYDTAFNKAGISVVKPYEKEQKHVTSIIYDAVKAGNFSIDITAFKRVVSNLIEQGAQVLVLACTELPIAFDVYKLSESTLNPTTILAAAAIKAAGAQLV